MQWVLFIFIALVGLCLGSFTNALEWRLRRNRLKQGEDDDYGEAPALTGLPALKECFKGLVEEVADWLTSPVRALKQVRKPRKYDRFSIANGRSMCPHCTHELAGKDLVPVLSWLWLRGKCRYCHKPISWQYPVVELITAVLFVGTFVWWPYELQTLGEGLRLGLWLLMLTAFVALGLYDAKYRYLPNEILYPALWLGVIIVILEASGVYGSAGPLGQGILPVLRTAAFGVLACWGLFFAIWCVAQVTGNRLIGYGDVRLAVLIGLMVGGPLPALAVLFLASLLGVFAIIPAIVSGKAGRGSEIPYGPFLLLATSLLYLFGGVFTDWFYSLFIIT